jgi:hypothetical protein
MGDKIVDAISTILSGSVPFDSFSSAASVDHEVANDLHLAAVAAHTARNELRQYPLLHPTHSSKMILLEDALVEQYRLCGDTDIIDEAIMLYRITLVLHQSSSLDQVQPLHHLANTLANRYSDCGNPKDMDETITLSRKALVLCSREGEDRDHTRLTALLNLARILAVRWQNPRSTKALITALSRIFQREGHIELNLRPHDAHVLCDLAGTLVQ